MYDELIEALRLHADTDGKCTRDTCPYYDEEACSAVLAKNAADAIEDLNKTLDEEVEINTALRCNMPVWIPVTERLPEKIGYYLAHIANINQMSMATDVVALWDGSDFYVSSFVAVTHWMPLPEPPESEGE